MRTLRNALIGLGAIALATVAGLAVSHGGGLDKDGCHHDRKNGDYHCHR
ncbi:MAG: YHYH domain-containing protein [Rhizobacter sp.]|nr:YHYH domain-containing protein [Rhizobacter sp.]